MCTKHYYIVHKNITFLYKFIQIPNTRMTKKFTGSFAMLIMGCLTGKHMCNTIHCERVVFCDGSWEVTHKTQTYIFTFCIGPQPNIKTYSADEGSPKVVYLPKFPRERKKPDLGRIISHYRVV